MNGKERADMMENHGFVRVAAAVPSLRVADCAFNAERILDLMARAEHAHVAILLFPELSLTGYTCGDLFHQTALQRGARDALAEVARHSEGVFSGLAVVGLPLVVDDRLFNCAAVLHRGRVLAIIPKSYLPNYTEFYEGRWFAAGIGARGQQVVLDGEAVPFGTDCLFEADDVEELIVGVEICEDFWVPIPPSTYQALRGAIVLLNLSASNEVIGKAAYRRQLVTSQSGRCIAAYVYASCGVCESSTDVVFGGHCMIAENGGLLAESPRFQREETLLLADVDIGRLRAERLRVHSFADCRRSPGADRLFTRIPFSAGRHAAQAPRRLARPVEAHPFVPRGQEQLRERCEEIFHTQVAGLARRLEHVCKPPVTLGISGGLDSTLALLVTCKTLDLLGMPRQRIHAFTMPGFGTTPRTRNNATALMQELGVTAAVIDIRALCLAEMRALGHRPFGIPIDGFSDEEVTERLRQVPAERRHDLVFENVQARMRTSILMNSGFVIGTGDLSEAALGWCTYNGDHMSMYNPNAGIPKTLVKFLVRWVADNEFEGEARRILLDIIATDISPELLPTGEDGAPVQATEDIVGPYELHDFFLFHLLRWRATPEKVLYLAGQAAFDRPYAPEEIHRWLRVFVERFFANQFKRSCVPDGPKVGSVSLSPRGDWRMPSDAHAALWLRWLAAETQLHKKAG
jgi:NAD+ synthase (glutamine-hydrolysing)